MTTIAYAFLQHRHLTQVGRKKESTDRRLGLACRPYATPSSISFFDHYLSNAHTAEDEAVKNSGVGKSAKVVLGGIVQSGSTESAAMDQRIRFCTTANGVRLAYGVSGDGPPLVLSAT